MHIITGKGQRKGKRIQIILKNTSMPLCPRSAFSINSAYFIIIVIIWMIAEIITAPIIKYQVSG